MRAARHIPVGPSWPGPYWSLSHQPRVPLPQSPGGDIARVRSRLPSRPGFPSNGPSSAPQRPPQPGSRPRGAPHLSGALPPLGACRGRPRDPGAERPGNQAREAEPSPRPSECPHRPPATIGVMRRQLGRTAGTWCLLGGREPRQPLRHNRCLVSGAEAWSPRSERAGCA